MAKISANGAHEVARLSAISQRGTRYILVMTSDGRVLSRATGDADSGYVVVLRNIPQRLRNKSSLFGYADRCHWTVKG